VLIFIGPFSLQRGGINKKKKYKQDKPHINKTNKGNKEEIKIMMYKEPRGDSPFL
jgi:hypothetical protein